MKGLNLARDPFLNRRPIRQGCRAAVGSGRGLTAVNGWSYWRHFVGQDRQQSELAELEPKIAEERGRDSMPPCARLSDRVRPRLAERAG